MKLYEKTSRYLIAGHWWVYARRRCVNIKQSPVTGAEIIGPSQRYL